MDTATSIVDPEQVAATLEAAADYIDEHGWCQNALKMPDGSVCAEGAICEVSETYDWQVQIYEVLRRHGCEKGVYVWNDEPGREEWEVTDLLRSTAKKVCHGDIELGTK